LSNDSTNGCEWLSLSLGNLKEVSKAVADIDLSDHLVSVMIALFDDDGN